MSRRLSQAGVDLRWQVGDLPVLPQLGPKHVLEITRIVQEAIANALKHSGAKRIGVAARTEQGAQGVQIVVEVSDAGGGFGAQRGEGTGRGIAGMQRRAAWLGGRLHIASDPSGTTVRLELPLAAPSKQPAPEQALEHGRASGAGLAHSDLVE
jgi:signal transduction histidine kinase